MLKNGRAALFNFSASNFSAAAPIRSCPKGWEPDEAVVNDFHDFLLKNDAQFTDAEFTDNHAVGQGSAQARDVHHRRSAWTNRSTWPMEQDPEIQKAIEAMPKAKALLDNAKKMMVQREARQHGAARSSKIEFDAHRLLSSTPEDNTAI